MPKRWKRLFTASEVMPSLLAMSATGTPSIESSITTKPNANQVKNVKTSRHWEKLQFKCIVFICSDTRTFYYSSVKKNSEIFLKIFAKFPKKPRQGNMPGLYLYYNVPTTEHL
jgi:hypothetical protein